MATEGAGSSIACTSNFIKSKPGIIRLAEAVIGVCGIISESVGSSCGAHGTYSFYDFVVFTTLVFAVIVIVIYSLGMEKTTFFLTYPCFRIQLVIFVKDIIFTILYLIAAILMMVAITSCDDDRLSRIFASIFAVCGTIVVGLLALLGHRQIQSDAAAADAASNGGPKSGPV